MGKVVDTPSFNSFIKYVRLQDQRKEIIVILLAYLILYLWFINLFSLPSTLTDSANYVFCAKTHHPGGYRPYGYSAYLGFIHLFSSSIGFVTISQFLITAFSTLSFAYTVKFFFNVQNGLLWYCFLAMVVVDLPTVYMAHSLLSDSLFFALTLTWITTGIWIFFTRSLPMYAVHLLMLYWALEVRYTSLFYPAFTVLILLLSFNKATYKLVLIALCLIVSVYFYRSTKSEMKRDFGVDTFSGFSGWQLLSNAMHVVPYVDLKPHQARDQQTRAFLEFIEKTDKSLYAKEVNASLMWSKKSPLKEYAYGKMQSMQIDYLQSWLLCGEDFSKFGSYLIKKNPGAFFSYYLLPNSWNVLYPPTDRGVIVRIEELNAGDLFHDYYGLSKTIKFGSDRSTLFHTISPFLSSVNLIFWLLFLSSIAVLIYHRRILLLEKEKFYCCWFLVLFAVGYAGFNIFAGPFEYRYIIPIRPIMVLLPWVAISLMQSGKSGSKQNGKSE